MTFNSIPVCKQTMVLLHGYISHFFHMSEMCWKHMFYWSCCAINLMQVLIHLAIAQERLNLCLNPGLKSVTYRLKENRPLLQGA